MGRAVLHKFPLAGFRALMDDQENTPLPEDPPVTVGDDEVEQLLAQAQEMADEIASTAGVETDARDLDSAPQAHAQDGVDPLVEAEAVEETLAELGDLVDGIESAEGASETEASGTVQAEPVADSDVAAAAGESEASAEETAVAGRSADGPDVAGVEPAEGSGGDVEFEGELGGEADVDLGDSSEQVEGQDDTGGEGEPKLDAPQTKWSIKSLLTAARDSAFRTAAPVVSVVPRAISAAFILLDRPFANISPTTKRRIGYVALVTVLMGLASLLLPGAFEYNPYEHLEP